MSVTSLYVSACRAAIRGAPGLRELRSLLPAIRALVVCPGCGRLDGGSAPSADEIDSCMCRPETPVENDDERDEADRDRRRLYAAAYVQLCAYVARTDAFRRLAEREDADSEPDALEELVREAARIAEGRRSPLAKARSELYRDSSTQTSEPSPPVAPIAPVLKPLANGSSYSVMYAGSGNKLTFKRKPPEEVFDKIAPAESRPADDVANNPNNFKKPAYRSRGSNNKRKGCRCGNATATPGKLTCCGQRCPCYVDSKPCTECKCKGCRNPHRADGQKVRPHIPQLEHFQLSVPVKRERSPIHPPEALEEPDIDPFEPNVAERSASFDPVDVKSPNIKVYASRLQEMSPEMTSTIVMGEDASLPSPASEDSGSPHGGLQSARSLLVPVHNILIPFHRQSTTISGHQDSASDIEVEV